MKKIYCKNLTRESNIEKFLNNYFEKDCPATYYKKGGLECKSNKNRSIEALYYLVKTEYPSVSFKRFIKVLSKLAVKRKAIIIDCSDIKKYTFFKNGPVQDFNYSWNGDTPLLLEFNKIGLIFNCSTKNGEIKKFKVFGKYTNYDLYKIITND